MSSFGPQESTQRQFTSISMISVLIWFGLEVGIGWAGILSIVRKTLWTPVGMLAEREISTLSCETHKLPSLPC